MLPAERLPPELWLIIFELARESSNGPRQYCNYLTFPRLNLHLRRPSEHAFTIHLWPHTFRLICSYFNSLLETPPAFFMKDADSAIPVSTRALYIPPQREPGQQACLQRVLADPSTCNRITILNLPGSEGRFYSPPTNFDFLCDKAHSLPAVRTLTLGFLIPGVTAPVIPRFWWRLNKAFPLLITFVLRGGLSTTHCDAEVVFKHLEVIGLESVDHHASLQLPALRHASFSSVYDYMLPYFANRPLLESLLVRGLSPELNLEWSEFPNLRTLGLSAPVIPYVFPPLPPYHPLQHLYVFMCARATDDISPHLFVYAKALRWLNKTISQMPTITRLSLWFDKCPRNYLNSIFGFEEFNSIPGYFREEDLEALGFSQREFPPRNCENGYHVVFERSIRG